MICTLLVPENNCPHLCDDKKHCSATTSGCSFRMKEPKKTTAPKEYVRKERWYEKFYK